MHLRPCSADLRPGIPRSLSVITAVALATGACSTGGGRSVADSTPSPLPCRRDAAPISHSDTSVLSTGATPASTVRYRPSARRVVHAAVSQSITETDISVDGPVTTRVSAQVPYTVRFSAVCGPVFTTTTVYGKPRVRASGKGAASARSRLDLLDGLIVREARDTHGRLLASSRSAPAGVDATTQRSLDDLLGQLAQSAVVFPERPLGVGARWTSQRDQSVSGFALTSTAQYTITGRTTDEVTLDVRLDVGAAPQVRSAQGSRVSLMRYRGTGSGTLRINLATGLASTGTITLKVDQQTRSGDSQINGQVTQVVTLSAP